MKVIGLTGGIGTGKSTASEYLIDKGFVHIDADKIGAAITADGSPVLKVLDEVFGPNGEMGVPGTDILNSEGNLDRKALASVVFVSEEKTQKLNSIMFEKIIDDIKALIEKYEREGEKYVLIDAPLLFEAGADSLCDKVIVITAEKDIRIRRVCDRDGATPDEVCSRIDRQLGDSEKVMKADYLVDNSFDRDHLFKQLEEICKFIVDNN